MKIPNFLLFSSLFLISCTDNTDTPSQVAEKYWSTIQRGDTQSTKQLISSNSTAQHDKHIKSLDHISIDNFVVDNAKTTVTTIINPEAPIPDDEIIFETRLVFENKQWKIDLNNTHVPQVIKKENPDTIANELSKSIQKNVESIEDVMDEGINIFNDALKEGSEEMGKSMLDAMKSLNEKMKKSIESLKDNRRKNQTPSKNPDDKSGEGLI